MATAGDIINEALQDLGVIRPGETVSATVTADCLLRLNQLISALSTEQLMAQGTKFVSSYNLQAGISRYTFGVGGTWNTASRPQKITGWRCSYGTFQSGGAMMTMEELDSISRDSGGTAKTLPDAVGSDAAYPTINVGVFPTPGSPAAAIELIWYGTLTQFAATTDAVTLPDGWNDMLHFNLAIALHPRYGRQNFDMTTLAANAQNSKAKIVELNKSSAGNAAEAQK